MLRRPPCRRQPRVPPLRGGGVAAETQSPAGVVEPGAGPEERGARGPERAVAVGVLGAKLAAERDELGQVGHGVGLARTRRCARARAHRGSRRAAARGRDRKERTGAASRSARDNPRRSSPARRRTGARRAARTRRRARRSSLGRKQLRHSTLSSAAPCDLVPHHEKTPRRDRPVDVFVARARARRTSPRTATARRRCHRRADDGRARRSDRCRSAARPSKLRTGASVMNSVSIAPTRCTTPKDARPSASRADRRSSSAYTCGSRRRRRTESPAAVASGFPDSVPA